MSSLLINQYRLPKQVGMVAGTACAVLLAVLPGALALDSGGVFPWTYWLAAMLAIVLVLLACVAYVFDPPTAGIQPHLLTLAILACAIYACFQSVPLPTAITGILASGSAKAWSQWMPLDVSEELRLGDESFAPVSVYPNATTNSAAILFVLAGLSWAASTVFHTRGRLLILLIIMAIAGVAHSFIGFWQLLDTPQRTIWGLEGSSPFGVFLNRNNAAVFLAISLACSLGLIGWRLTAVTGHHFGGSEFTLGLLLDLTTDRIAMIAGLGTAVNLAALFACGSRGGLIGALVGTALSIGFMRSRHLARQLVAFLVIGSAVAGLLLVRFEVSPRSLERLGASARGAAESIYEDGRLVHWQDGWSAMLNYAPAGSGFGSYRYAYLPFQENGTEGWCHHADNLWLEWLVEGGVMALFLIMAVAGVLVYALVQLRETADPLDHGIATMGWALLGIIGCSQMFDFGLLLCGAAIASTILCSTVLGRAATQGVPLWRFRVSSKGGRLRFSAGSSAIVGVTFGALLIFGLVISGYRLSTEAHADALARAVRDNRFDTNDLLESTRVHYDEFWSSHPAQAELGQQVAWLDLSAARLKAKEVFEREQVWDEGVSLSPPSLFLWMLRSIDLIHEDEFRGQDEVAMERIFEQALSASSSDLAHATKTLYGVLGSCPLAPEPRLTLAILCMSKKIAERSDEETVQHECVAPLLDQALVLRKENTVTLLALADIAAVANQWELATEAWKRAILNDLNMIEVALNKAEVLGHPDRYSLLPDDEESYRLASVAELAKNAPNQEFLSKAVVVLQEQMPADRAKRSKRFVLLGKLYGALGKAEDQLKMYERATETDRANVEVSLAYAYALISNNRIAAAGVFLESLREKAPIPDQRIEKAIEKLDEKRKQLKLENSSNATSILPN